MVLSIGIIFLVIGLLLGYLLGKKYGETAGYVQFDLFNVHTIEDDLPEKTDRKTLAMKLQNEIMPYLFVEDGKVKLYVVRPDYDYSDPEPYLEEEHPIIEYVEVAPGEYDEETAPVGPAEGVETPAN